MIVASVFSPPEAEEFHGYCYIDQDLVIGSLGAQEYSAATGNSIPPGLDGCYTTLVKSQDRWVWGTDSRGLSRLFLYRRGAVWAVASSLFGLVEHLRSNGVYPSLRENLVEPYNVGDTFTQQPASLETIFDDIELVPSFCTVDLICGRNPEIVPLADEETPSYELTLERHITLWSSRLSTIMAHPNSRLTVDLSGGLDSRVVFAFILASGQFDTQNKERFRLVSNPAMPRDYKIARKIAGDFGLELNAPAFKAKAHKQPSDVLRDWRETNLGVYTPLYLPNSKFDPLLFHAHGGGGGASRRTITSNSIASKLSNYKSVLSAKAFKDWATSVSESMVRLRAMRPDIDPLILHYAEFRNRFHFGHRPHRTVMFTPLNSKLLDFDPKEATSSSRQHFYDVMESLVPGLSKYSFDSAEKNPTASERENILRVVKPEVKAGTIYGAEIEPQESEIRGSNAYRKWISESRVVIRNRKVQEVLGDESTHRAKKAIDEAMQSTKALRANDEGILALSHAQMVAFALEI